jgi:2',3'-cyclic-nucleotide 2'-phosphodiesterase (5'-nucleotidase family)
MATLNRVLIALLFFYVALLPTDHAVAGERVETRLTFVLICDIYEMQADRNGRGGMARAAAVVRSERAAGGNVIVAHAGDTISPSLMSGIDKGAHMIELINMIRPDVFVPGNHEFDFGPEVFRKRMSEATFPVLAANLRDASGDQMASIADKRMIEMGGVKVGLIGLTAEDSVKRSSPGNLQFSSSLDTGERLARQLRAAGADLIVVVAHAARKLDRKLITAGFADIILSGDDHDLLVGYDGRTAFAEAMQDGLYVTVIDVDVDIEVDGGRRKVDWWPNFRVIDTQGVQPDQAVADQIAKYQALLGEELDVALGTTASELDSRNAAVRGGEAAIGNLFADAVRAATGADVAILNGGGIRGNKVYPAGSKITRRDVLAELPFGNKALVVELTGAALMEVLEQALQKAHKKTTGAFPQVSGLTIRADTSRKKGKRLVDLKIGGEPVDPDRVYRVATNTFLARGGNGYSAMATAKRLIGEADGKLVANHVMAYIRAQGTVAANIEGRTIIARE